MPRPPKSPVAVGSTPTQPTFILDNGAATIKAGFAPLDPESNEETLARCSIVPNAIVRTREKKVYVAASINEITQWDEAVVRRPCEHGQVVSWEAQKEIWDRSFFDGTSADTATHIKDPEDTVLIFTEPPNTLPVLQKNADEVIIEEWGFARYLRTTGPPLNAFNNLYPLFESRPKLENETVVQDGPAEAVLVVESGYSHTIIMPIWKGVPLERSIRRIDFGGKHLTNLLKEVVSVRYFDLHQDAKIVNDIKEDVCFVSQDFRRDMERTWKGNRNREVKPTSQRERDESNLTDLDGKVEIYELRVDYVLPDGINLLRGFSRPHDPSTTAARKRKLDSLKPDAEIVMTLGCERFAIPEVLFNPADIGSKQTGLVECILSALSVLPPLVQAAMLSNVLVVGGNGKIPGFVERIQNELRMQVRTEWAVRVRKMNDPTTSTWLGGARLASRHADLVREHSVTKEEYHEHGSIWVARKFANILR